MKKLMLAGISILVAMTGFAQVSFGVQVIGNLSSASVKTDQGIEFTKTMKELPGAGIVVQYDLSEKLSIRSGINYLQHGVILESKFNPTTGIQAKAENTLHYLQLPVNILYNIPVGKIKLYAGAGGFINYGVSGESIQTIREVLPDDTETVTTEKLKAFKKDDDGGAGLKKGDLGAGVLAGIRFNNGIFANLGYQLSLTNISDGDGKYKNQGIQLSAGFVF